MLTRNLNLANKSKAKVSGYKFTKLPPPKGSGVPPTRTERILFMKQKLYTIPVNEAFAKDCECPLCEMYDSLEKENIEYVMGSSYMVDDIRMQTNRAGFCAHHIKLMYKNQNRQGLALMLLTHMQTTNQEIQKHMEGKVKGKSLFHKKTEDSLADYLEQLEHSCFVCERMEPIFERFVDTVVHSYQHETDFQTMFKHCKGFCTKHYAMLRKTALQKLSGNLLEEFIEDLNRLYMENMQRVTDDLEWFTDKFDYRNANAPWKNSKDALPRSIVKTNHTMVE